MELTDLVETADALSTLSAPALFVVFIIGLMREWWVFGRELKACRRDRDEWKRWAMQGTDLLDKAVTIADRRRD